MNFPRYSFFGLYALAICLLFQPALEAQIDDFRNYYYNENGRQISLATRYSEIFVTFQPGILLEDQLRVVKTYASRIKPIELNDIYPDANAILLRLKKDFKLDVDAFDQLIDEIRANDKVASANPVFQEEDGRPIYVINRFEFRIKDNVSSAEIASYLEENNAQVLAIELVDTAAGKFVVTVASQTSAIEAANALYESGLVDYARPTIPAHHTVRTPDIVFAQTFPNPTSGENTLEYHLAFPGPVYISLHYLDGRMLAPVVNNQNHAAGRYFLPIDLTKYPPGTYYIHLKTQFEGYFAKVIVIH